MTAGRISKPHHPEVAKQPSRKMKSLGAGQVCSNKALASGGTIRRRSAPRLPGPPPVAGNRQTGPRCLARLAPDFDWRLRRQAGCARCGCNVAATHCTGRGSRKRFRLYPALAREVACGVISLTVAPYGSVCAAWIPSHSMAATKSKVIWTARNASSIRGRRMTGRHFCRPNKALRWHSDEQPGAFVHAAA